jgi:hypothetical protein
MAKTSKAETKTKTPEVVKEENTVRILPPHRKRTTAVFWDVYRNTTSSSDE